MVCLASSEVGEVSRHGDGVKLPTACQIQDRLETERKEREARTARNWQAAYVREGGK